MILDRHIGILIKIFQHTTKNLFSSLKRSTNIKNKWDLLNLECATYHCREEIQEVRHNRDPITGFREKMVSAGLADADELKQIELEVRKSVSDWINKQRHNSPIYDEG